MIKKIVPLCLTVIFILGTTVSQADKPKDLPAGKPIITSADLEKFQLEIAPELTGKPSEYAIMRVVPVDRMPFDKAIRIQTLGWPKSEDHIRLVMTAPKPIADNDVLFLTYYIRASRAVRAETGAGIQAKFTRIKFNRANSLAQEERIGVKKAWTRVQVPFYSSGSWDPKSDPARLVFCLGFPEQTVEIGGIELVNYDGAFDIRKLPHPKNTYAGRELDAPWRKAAAERIEKIRKSDLTILVTDAQGRPVPGATVSVIQKEHAFLFGTHVDALLVMEDERYLKGYGVAREDCPKYRQMVLDLFNTGSVDYCLSWPVFEYHNNPDPNNRGRRKSEMGLETVKWLKQHGKRACGTQLIWPQYIPKDLQNFEDGEKMKTRARKFIVDVIKAVPENECWIAFNESAWDLEDPESFPEKFFSRVGRDFMVEGFKLAHKTNPQAKYILNDCRLESWGGMEKEKQQAVENQLRFLLSRGAPVDGLGLQSHFVNSVMTPPDRVLEIFDRYAKVVKEIWITEYDTDTMDEKLRADYLRDYLTVCFSHPAVRGFIHWSLWEGRSNIPNLSLFKKDWTPKPAVKVWKDLVFNQWRTRQNGQTDQNGKFQVRGFLGDYLLTASVNGKTVQSRITLPKTGYAATLIIK